MSRYVILHHRMPAKDGRATHWDVMLERDGALMTWALADEPVAGQPMAAARLDDHRLHYLSYEGPVSGNRGSVAQWDHGEVEWLDINPNEIRVRLTGGRLPGTVQLQRGTKAASDAWTFFLSAPAASQ